MGHDSFCRMFLSCVVYAYSTVEMLCYYLLSGITVSVCTWKRLFFLALFDPYRRRAHVYTYYSDFEFKVKYFFQIKNYIKYKRDIVQDVSK